ncbi:MAG: hypothetical protein H6608_04360 [Flavobacteriales bacterium]|nr:hypothetical protein [Flavobacteriales bacterium]
MVPLCTEIQTPRLTKTFLLVLMGTLARWLNPSEAAAQQWTLGQTIEGHAFVYPEAWLMKADSNTFQIHVKTDRKLEVYELDSGFNPMRYAESKEHLALWNHSIASFPIPNGWLLFQIHQTSLSKSTLYATTEKWGSTDTIVLMELQNSFVSESQIRFSRSHGEFLIWFEWKRSPRVDPEEVTVIHFNPSSYQTRIDTILPGYSNELIHYFRCWQNSQGETCLLGRLFDNSPVIKRAGKPNYRYCLTTFLPDKKTTRTDLLTDGLTYDQGIYIARNDSGYLYGVMRSDKPGFCDTISLYQYNSLTGTRSTLFSKKIELPRDYRKSYTYHRFRRKPINLWLDRLEIGSDGEITIWMEFYERRVQQAYVNHRSYKYIYGPLVRYNRTLDSFLYRDKLQVTMNDHGKYGSYRIHTVDTSECLFMNLPHHPERKRNLLGNLRMLNHTSDLVMVPVQNDSRMYELRDNQTDKFMPDLSSMTWLNNDTFVVLLLRKRDLIPARCRLGFTP